MATSYGTLVVNRYMVLYPNSPIQGVILDSVVDPTRPHFAYYDKETSDVATSFLQTCNLSPACKAKWAPEGGIVPAFQETLAQVAAKTQSCVNTHFPALSGPEGASRIKRKALFGQAVESFQYYERMAVPAFIYRLRRCSADDVPALQKYAKETGLDVDPKTETFHTITSHGSAADRQSMVINALINGSELWHGRGPAPNMDDLRRFDKEGLFSPGAALEIGRLLEAGFPTYRPDEHFMELADPAYPVMMLNGTGDLGAPVQYVNEIARKRPHWYYRPFPLVGHTPFVVQFPCVLMHIPLFFAEPNINPFGFHLCAGKMPTSADSLDWLGTTAPVQNASEKLFGTPKLYG
jgi:pimeloyl-ACP methyl ester carboxylesterase